MQLPPEWYSHALNLAGVDAQESADQYHDTQLVQVMAREVNLTEVMWCSCMCRVLLIHAACLPRACLPAYFADVAGRSPLYMQCCLPCA